MNFPVFTKEGLTNCRYCAIKEHLYSELNGEAVILSLTTGKYYGLNAVGVSVWTAIQEPTTFQDIQSVVMEQYDVDRETCNREVSAFLQRMAEEGLIEVKNEAVA